jgi:hypothetical protein
VLGADAIGKRNGEAELSTILRAVGGLLWRTDILYGFPVFKCHLDRQNLSMLALVGVLLDGSARRCESATTYRPTVFSARTPLRMVLGKTVVLDKNPTGRADDSGGEYVQGAAIPSGGGRYILNQGTVP